MDDGESCTTMWMYLVPMNTQLNKVKIVYFMLCDFHRNKKNTFKKTKNNNKKLTTSHFPPVLPNMQVISSSEKKKNK